MQRWAGGRAISVHVVEHRERVPKLVAAAGLQGGAGSCADREQCGGWRRR